LLLWPVTTRFRQHLAVQANVFLTHPELAFFPLPRLAEDEDPMSDLLQPSPDGDQRLQLALADAFAFLTAARHDDDGPDLIQTALMPLWNDRARAFAALNVLARLASDCIDALAVERNVNTDDLLSGIAATYGRAPEPSSPDRQPTV
jgi:hypothetical protein